MESVTEYIEIIIGGIAAFIAWLSLQIKRWKAIENTAIKAAIAVGVFIVIALLLSVITAPFN